MPGPVLLPERVYERTSFVLVFNGASACSPLAVTGGHNPGLALNPAPPDIASANFLGWSTLCIGLRASAAQRRLGIWCHREDWVWRGREVETAKTVMAVQAKGEGDCARPLAAGAVDGDIPSKRSSRYRVALFLVPVTVQRLKESELFGTKVGNPACGPRSAQAGTSTQPAKVAKVRDSVSGLRLRPVVGLTWPMADFNGHRVATRELGALSTLASLEWLVASGALDASGEAAPFGNNGSDISLEVPEAGSVALLVKRYSRAKRDGSRGWGRL